MSTITRNGFEFVITPGADVFTDKGRQMDDSRETVCVRLSDGRLGICGTSEAGDTAKQGEIVNVWATRYASLIRG